jgi:hypothetical protein
MDLRSVLQRRLGPSDSKRDSIVLTEASGVHVKNECNLDQFVIVRTEVPIHDPNKLSRIVNKEGVRSTQEFINTDNAPFHFLTNFRNTGFAFFPGKTCFHLDENLSAKITAFFFTPYNGSLSC